MAGTGAVWAQSPWVYSFTMPMEIEHDSNPNMSVLESPGTTWLRLRPSLAWRYLSGAEEYEVEGGLTAEKSSNPDVAKDRIDPRLRGSWKHTGPRDNFQLAALLDRQAFRALDVREHSPLGVDGARSLLALSGNWKRELDARTSSNVDLRQEWQRYTDTSSPDFRQTVGEMRLTRQRERGSWYAALNGQLYRSDAPVNPNSTSVGALFGMTHALGESLRIEANAGPVYFDPASKLDWQAALKAEYAAERWLTRLDLSRTTGVNSTFGGLVGVEEVRFHSRYTLGPFTRLEVDASGSREAVASSTRSQAGIAWIRALAPAWGLAVRASAHRQEDALGSARNNRVSLVLVYSGQDL